MEETRKVQVHPRDEQAQTEIWQDFGWTLVSSQEINSKESHLERRGNDIITVTTKENYVNLLFKRDTNMPNYSEITQLEAQFDAVPGNTIPNHGKLKTFLVILALIAIIVGVILFSKNVILGGIICTVLAGGAITGIVFKIKSEKKKDDLIKAQNAANNKRRAELRQKSRALLA